MATYSFSEPTNREDLSDVITNISPTETPLTSAFGKTKAKSTKHEWVEDDLADARKNAHAEGEDVTAEEVGARKRLYNYTQIMQRSFKVTETQQAVDTAGVSNEYAYQQYKAMKALAKDLEYALVNNAEAKINGAKGDIPEMGGVQAFVKTNIVKPKALDGDAIADALEAAWKAGGEPGKVYCSGKNKRLLSKMTTSNTKTVAAKEKTLTEAVDVYDSDFGRVEIVASRFMPDDKLFVLDPSLFKIAWLRNFKKNELPKMGDSKAGYIIGEMTLEARAEKGNAIIDLGKGE